MARCFIGHTGSLAFGCVSVVQESCMFRSIHFSFWHRMTKGVFGHVEFHLSRISIAIEKHGSLGTSIVGLGFHARRSLAALKKFHTCQSCAICVGFCTCGVILASTLSCTTQIGLGSVRPCACGVIVFFTKSDIVRTSIVHA